MFFLEFTIYMNYMKRFLFLIVLCVASVLVCVDVWAVPAKPIVKTIVMSDGTEVEVILRGDENNHYYETLEGARVKSMADGRWQVVDAQQATVDIQLAPRKRQHSSQLSTDNSLFHRAPHHAERGLVILVEFSDLSFVNTRENFDDLLNKENYDHNGATGSALDYFRDASNGQYMPQFDVFGPYKLDREVAYYGENDADGIDKHPDQMVVDAMIMLAMDSTVNVNFADYDADNNGYIDNIFIFYAGLGENENAPAHTIWPHAWAVYDEYVEGQLVYDGKTISGYACASELRSTRYGTETMCGIGTFCHEFSHVLGLPDWYVTDYSSSHKTLGKWSVMDAGSYLNEGNTPPTFSAHERFYLGWLTPEILNEKGDYRLDELQLSNMAYMITVSGEHNLDGANPDPATYYLLENRQKNGWDKYLPSAGLMITKTVYDESTWVANVPNNNPDAQGYDIIEADGQAPNGSDGRIKDLFPYGSAYTSFAPFDEYSIFDITLEDGVISFSFTDSTAIESGDSIVANVAIDMSTIALTSDGAQCKLIGVADGAEVCCYDALGRLLWRNEGDDDEIYFVRPQGFYLIRIVDNNNEYILKGL